MRSAIPPLRTILVPTDFSEIANAAVPYGYSLLRGTGGTVELCHVHEGHLFTPVHAYGKQERLSPEQTKELETRLRALVPPESEGLGIATRLTVIDGGSAAEAICRPPGAWVPTPSPWVRMVAPASPARSWDRWPKRSCEGPTSPYSSFALAGSEPWKPSRKNWRPSSRFLPGHAPGTAGA